MKNILTKVMYPKKMFRKNDVYREINKMQYPKAWRVDENKNHYILCLDKQRFEDNYVRKKSINMPSSVSTINIWR